MATNAGKKKTGTVDEMVGDLADRLQSDRQRVSDYLTKLLSAIDLNEDPFSVVAAADSVAKVADALTRQSHLSVEALKVLIRRETAGDKTEETYDEIGLPFEEDVPEKDGSN